MYEIRIVYSPITKNTMMKIKMEESFEYEENGVKAILTPESTIMIDTPKPNIYNIKEKYCTESSNKTCDKCWMLKERKCIKNMHEIDGWW